jgi:hypothetical protein
MLRADTAFWDQQIWDACWAGDPTATSRIISYPPPVSIGLRNDGGTDIYVCVYDNRCPYTIFKGRLMPRYTATALGACTDKWGHASITAMDNTGGMWLYENTGARTISFR